MSQINTFKKLILLTSWIIALGVVSNGSILKMPWDQGLFKAEPQMILKAVESIPDKEGENVHIYLREKMFVVDEQGRFENYYRWVYKILSPHGKENWSNTTSSWSPWYQEKPQFRVRICNPDGSVHELDPSTIVEVSSENDSSNTYSDCKTLRAPFPGVTVGSIIEEERYIKEIKPFFDAGMVRSFSMSANVPVDTYRVVVIIPEKVPFKYQTVKLHNLKIKKEKINGMLRYTFVNENVPETEEYEDNLPPDKPRKPLLTISTAESWKNVASRYSEYVDNQLVKEDLSAVIADLKKENVRDTAIALMKWMNRHVRYIGLELGESSIIPVTPSETLSRKYGDCKDKATLLVGLLRQTGYHADVALLQTVTLGDINPEMPGFGLMNHAIVYVGGDHPFWLDPTGRFSRDGYLPLADQDRWALICNAKTTELVKTPASASAENTLRETRKYILLDKGKANVLETTIYSGSVEYSARQNYFNTKDESLKETLEDYVKSNYRSGDLTEYKYTDPMDKSEPFKIELNIESVGRGLTQGNEAVVAIIQKDIIQRLPKIFKREIEEKRRSPYYFYEPFVSEIKYIIIPPKGFVIRRLPESEVLQMGPARLEKQFHLEKDQTVTANLLFDTGGKVMSPEEYEELHKKILEFLKSKAILIYFDHQGEKLMNLGQYREAFNLFQSLVREEPGKVIHQIRLANAFLKAGLGEEAKDAAEKAVQLNPNNGDAHSTLGWVCQHDDLGRRFFPGFDREKAIKAYETAISLDPENLVFIMDLAILLEHDRDGYRYSPEADLERAIHYYRLLDDVSKKGKSTYKIKKEFLTNNLLAVLLWSKRYNNVKEEVKSIKNELNRLTYATVANTALNGVEAAVSELSRISKVETYRNVLLETGNLLIRLRMYPEAATILRKAAQGSENAVDLETRADIIENVVPFTEIQFDPHDPVLTIEKTIVEIMRATDGNFKNVRHYFSENAFRRQMDYKSKENFIELYAQAYYQAKKTNVYKDVLIDLGLAAIETSVEGNGSIGYHVISSIQIDKKKIEQSYYLTESKDGLIIIGTQIYFSDIGKFILSLIKNGKLKSAKQWLDWVLEDLPAYQDSDPLNVLPFHKFWNTKSKMEENSMRLAAAMVIILDDSQEEAIQIIKKHRKNTNDITMLNYLDFALATAYIGADNSDYSDEFIDIAQKLTNAFPDSSKANSLLLTALLFSEKYDDLRRVAEKRIIEKPKDVFAYQMLADMHLRRGEYTKACGIYRKLIDKNLAKAIDYNNLAWAQLFTGTISKKTLEEARTAVKLSMNNSSGYLHTMSTLYAEVGRCSEARKILENRLILSNKLTPESSDWYILGLIAEQYGVEEAAIRAYKKVQMPENRKKFLSSTYYLAQKRLNNLLK